MARECGEVGVRHCEYQGCGRSGLVEEMVRAPAGEWYCLEHAAAVLLPVARFSPAMTWTEPLEPAGPWSNPSARLLGVVAILGVPHHVDAVEVQTNEVGQRAVDEEFQGHVERLLEMEEGGPLVTVEIGGRKYVFLITPFQE